MEIKLTKNQKRVGLALGLTGLAGIIFGSPDETVAQNLESELTGSNPIVECAVYDALPAWKGEADDGTYTGKQEFPPYTVNFNVTGEGQESTLNWNSNLPVAFTLWKTGSGAPIKMAGGSNGSVPMWLETWLSHLTACYFPEKPTNTPTPTNTFTPTWTFTPTNTFTPRFSQTPSDTPTLTSTEDPEKTYTPSPSPSLTLTATDKPKRTKTPTPYVPGGGVYSDSNHIALKVMAGGALLTAVGIGFYSLRKNKYFTNE